MTDIEYPFSVRPLSPEEGGGFVIEFPDLPGCMSDGETVEQAIINGKDAVEGWIGTAKKLGREIPSPSVEDHSFSGKVLQRFPKYLHAKLARRAKQEGVSLNSLIQTLVAEGLGHREASDQYCAAINVTQHIARLTSNVGAIGSVYSAFSSNLNTAISTSNTGGLVVYSSDVENQFKTDIPTVDIPGFYAHVQR